LQAQFENGLSLRVGEQIALRRQTELGRQPLRARSLGAGAHEHFFDQRGTPSAPHDRALGVGRGRRRLDQGDDLIHVGQRDGQTFENMAALAGLAQFKDGAPGNDLAPMAEEALEQFLQVEQTRPTVDQRHHVHAEGVLQLGLLEQVIEHHVRHFTGLQLDHQTHARLVGFVLDVGDALDLLFLDQLGDLFLQGLLVDLVGQLIDDDGLAVIAAGNFLEVRARAHHHAAATGQVAVAHAGDAVDQSGGREVGRGDDLDQLLDAGLRIAQQRQAGIDDFVQVVRRNVGRHAHRDPRRAVDQQIGNARRQDQRFLFRAVVVRTEVDGFLLDVLQQFVADARHAHLGVAHRRRAVAVDRTKVALAVDQHVAQGKILRHAHNGVVHRRVAVRVVFTDHVADDTGRFLVGLVPVVAELVHGEQHPPMHGLEAVPCVGQGPAHDHAHRVIEVGMPHLLFQTDRQGFFGKRSHRACGSGRRAAEPRHKSR